MVQTPLHDVFNRLEDLIPAGAKAYRDLLPRQLLGSIRQKLHIGIGELMLPPRPRHLLYLDTTLGAIYTSHQVNQKHPISPQRDELKMAIVQPIIKGGRRWISVGNRWYVRYEHSTDFPHGHLARDGGVKSTACPHGVRLKKSGLFTHRYP